MDNFILTDILIEAYDLPLKISKDTFTTHDLILSLLTFTSIKDVSNFLEVSDSKLEHVIQRNLKPLVGTDKPRTKTWQSYFYALFGLKKCAKCLSIKDIEEFGTGTARLNSYCRECDYARTSSFKLNNPDKVKLSKQLHYVNNKKYYLHRNAMRRARKLEATPSWANTSKIKEIYLNCPVDMQVDHIYPLVSDWVCGLHVENNLQYLSPEENKRKSNKDIGQ